MLSGMLTNSLARGVQMLWDVLNTVTGTARTDVSAS